MRFLSSDSSLLTRLFQGLLGVLGLYAALRFLPRVLKSMTRRFLFGLIGEILLVALGLFFTRRAAKGPSGPEPRSNGSGASSPNRSSSQSSS